MANLDLLKQSLPLAPIKIAALEGCRSLAKEVDNQLVQYRWELADRRDPSMNCSGYCEDSFLLIRTLWPLDGHLL